MADGKIEIGIYIVNSVKGGSGKSTVSLQLARYLQEKEKRVPVIIDLDLCGSTWSRTYGHALKQNDKQLIEDGKNDYDSDEFVFIQNMLYNADKYLKKDYCFDLQYMKFFRKDVNSNGRHDPLKTFYEFEKSVLDAKQFIENEREIVKIKTTIEKTFRQATEIMDNFNSWENISFTFDNEVYNSCQLLKQELKSKSDFKTVFENAKQFLTQIHSLYKVNFNSLKLVLCDSKVLTNLRGDDLELLESLVCKIVKQCCVSDYYLENDKMKGITDIIFDLPPGYEKHAEQIIRNLIMDLKSPLYKEKIDFEPYLCMVSNVDGASIHANIDFVNHIKSDRKSSANPFKIKKGFFVFNDVNGKLNYDPYRILQTELNEYTEIIDRRSVLTPPRNQRCFTIEQFSQTPIIVKSVLCIPSDNICNQFDKTLKR